MDSDRASLLSEYRVGSETWKLGGYGPEPRARAMLERAQLIGGIYCSHTSFLGPGGASRGLIATNIPASTSGLLERGQPLLFGASNSEEAWGHGRGSWPGVMLACWLPLGRRVREGGEERVRAGLHGPALGQAQVQRRGPGVWLYNHNTTRLIECNATTEAEGRVRGYKRSLG